MARTLVSLPNPAPAGPPPDRGGGIPVPVKEKKSALLKGLVAVALVAAGLVPASPAQAKDRNYPVRSLDYTLGDTAFTVPGFHTDGPDSPLAPIELTGNVHYPVTGRGPFPLVVLSHGYWSTCADQAAEDEAKRIEAESPDDYYEDPRWVAATGRLSQWPCAPGVAALPSYRGYDYLARELAAQGMVVISISANGINAGQIGTESDNARAKLINKHLALWTELARTGRGALAGHFSGPTPKLTGKIDFSRTGTLGHSRGGRAVAWHAADVHRADLPAGVRVAGVLALAAANPGAATNPGSPDAKFYRVTSAPLAVWVGGCDSEQGLDYAKLATGHTRKPIYTWHVRGANHNFLNTQWSPESGQVGAVDDQGFAPAPGWCGTPIIPDWDPDSGTPEPPIEWTHVTRKLTETEQRQVSTGYVTAFFRSALLGDRQADKVISGRVDPYASFTVVDAEKIVPQRR
ncbi:hypothetical protein [Micromonospora sp. WMMD712]|uniref:hypothetical protein n=1 Tax=Micromonospora sp. WMMD712 TaxID=3016096 RepID=UPI002499C249|nr:hypothetical protein [Micromonospora sp. WMMD712]WFE59480.1 hypothetical protein O7633_22685 [Micromonospora sp. WMMD712]